MNAVEDRVRDEFAHVVVPDVPVPAIGSIQRRARRHRLNQATGALGAMATVGVCIVGGMSFNTTSLTTVQRLAKPGIVRIPTHVINSPGPQWLVAEQKIDGETYRAATITAPGNNPCVQTSDGFGDCDPSGRDWFYDSPGDFNHAGDGVVGEVAGRVPLDARKVTVTLPGYSVTTPAVRTPTTTYQRWFATWFPSQTETDNINPIVGVVDQNGEPTAPPGGSPSTPIGAPSNIAGLPRHQYLLHSGVPGIRLVGFIRNGETCLSLVPTTGTAKAPVCETGSSTADSARVLAKLAMPDGSTIVAGDAPLGTASVELARASGASYARTAQLPGDSEHVFWVAKVHGPTGSAPWLLATCAAGQNCWKVRTVTL